jgi:hypothetical protein
MGTTRNEKPKPNPKALNEGAKLFKTKGGSSGQEVGAVLVNRNTVLVNRNTVLGNRNTLLGN